ncbi:MAG: amino acid ABC transporter substrate-binding protein [Methanosphaera sp.]|nr:amino acid ABC transporter substrate-binding protein [Methanosphaera sp.]
MKKQIGFILGALILIFLVLGTVNAGFLDFLGGGNSNSTVAADNNTFVVGFDAEFPPYGYKNDKGEYVGFDLDLAQEVCNRNNWTLKKQPIDWDAKDTELNSGAISCIWNGFTINGREDQYTWSKPYIDNKQVIVTKKSSNINKLSDLKDKIVETQKDSSALSALEGDQKSLADTFKNLVQVADYNTAFMDLESGACDAIAMDVGVANYQINSKSNPSDYQILDEKISSEQYGVGFKKGNTELRDKVQATLDEMEKDGTIAKIAQNYEKDGVPGSLISSTNSTDSTNATN